MPSVSVVIPTRDRIRLLSRTLRSALAQRDVALQVIVVDDGSRDDTCAVVAALDDPRVRLVSHEAPLGVSAARNRGINSAEGEWLAFLDDDDLWAPDKLARQVMAMRQDARCWACVGSVTVTETLEILAGGPVPPAAALVSALAWRNTIPAGASNVVVQRELLDRCGMFDPALRHMADWDLWIRLGQSGLPSIVNEPLVAYRLHAGNASSDPATLLDELELIERRYSALRRGRPVDRAFAFRWAGWNYLRAGARAAAVRAYLRAVGVGDLRSIGRAAVAALDPRDPARPMRRHAPDPPWVAAAEAWLRELAA